MQNELSTRFLNTDHNLYHLLIEFPYENFVLVTIQKYACHSKIASFIYTLSVYYSVILIVINVSMFLSPGILLTCHWAS